MESNIDAANSAVDDWNVNSIGTGINGKEEGGEDRNVDETEDALSISSHQEKKVTFTIPGVNRRRLRNINVRSTAIVDDSTALDMSRPKILDHYSLPSSSSSINFRSSIMHIYNKSGSQIMLEERVTSKMGVAQAMMLAAADGGREDDFKGTEQSWADGDGDKATSTAVRDKNNFQVNITVKESLSTTPGQFLLRALYSSIAIFIGGFVFILAVGLLLFVISDLAFQATHTTEKRVFALFGTILSIPVLFNGLCYILVLITGFVVDMFSGNPLLLAIGLGTVVTNWVSFAAFIGVPVVSLIASLMARRQDFFQIFLITSVASVGLFFVIFALALGYLQFSATIHLVQELDGRRGMSRITRIKCAVLACARSYLSGKKENLYIYECNEYDLKNVSAITSEESMVYMSHGVLWLKFTQLPFLKCFFEELDVPERRWTRDEVDGVAPFLTKYSWSLVGVFCRARDRNTVTVVGGPASITPNQVWSNTICYFLGIMIYVLLTAAILVWFQAPATLTAVILALYIAYWVGKVKRGAKLSKKVMETVKHYNAEDEEQQGQGMLQKWECYTVTRPRSSFIWAYLAVLVFLFFMFPLVILVLANNVPGTIVFIAMAIVCLQQSLLSMTPILEELGDFATLGKKEGSILKHGGRLGVTSRSEWKYKSRLYHIHRMMNYRKVWGVALGSFVWLFIVVTIGASFSQPTEQTTTAAGSSQHQIDKLEAQKIDPLLTFPSSNVTHFYEGPQTSSHPMCHLDATDSTSSIQYLVDYVFLASIPYHKSETLQPHLDRWFGRDEAVHHEGAQLKFRELHPEFAESFGSYDLVTFPADSSAVVLVRGTKTYFDYISDARLWYSSALFQVLREALPFGNFFAPLIRLSTNALSLLETSSIKQSAYYLETSRFIEDLKESGEYANIVITGHSLGGGIALISGAQTRTKAVGLSAPNTVLGRDTVTPKLKLEDLEEFTFNIVPERDIFPKIGDQLRNVEKIKCRASVQDSFSCHAFERSLCEILYNCGNIKRPVPCECVTKFNYPEPTEVIGNETIGLATACGVK